MRPNLIKDGQIDLATLSNAAGRPALYSPGEELFWDDPHISQKMLEAHLNPEWDAASRNHETIDRTVDWLVKYLGLEAGDRILDIGCGPGLYCTRFKRYGLDVTGMDYSRNSIGYAEKYAAENGLDIRYVYRDYLTMDYAGEFDAIFLIYCDFGALSDENRDLLLEKIHRALKPGGVFVFDIFTRHNREHRAANNWYVSETGFWRPQPHLVLEQSFHYEAEDVFMHQHIVIDGNGEMAIYRIYDHVYSAETVSGLMAENGFEVRDIWSDLTGTPYAEDSGLLGIAARKTQE